MVWFSCAGTLKSSNRPDALSPRHTETSNSSGSDDKSLLHYLDKHHHPTIYMYVFF